MTDHYHPKQAISWNAMYPLHIRRITLGTYDGRPEEPFLDQTIQIPPGMYVTGEELWTGTRFDSTLIEKRRIYLPDWIVNGKG